MFIYWPWIGILAVCTLITAVLTLKLARKCGARLSTLPERGVNTYKDDEPDQFELEDGMNYNMQGGMDYPSSHMGDPDYPPPNPGSEYAASQAAAGYASSQAGYASSQAGYAASQAGYASSQQGGYAASQAGYAASQQGGPAAARSQQSIAAASQVSSRKEFAL